MPDDEEKPTIGNLIKALEIFASYGFGDLTNLILCDHDELVVLVSPRDITPVDLGRLNKLGFNVNQPGDCFSSFRYGDA